MKADPAGTVPAPENIATDDYFVKPEVRYASQECTERQAFGTIDSAWINGSRRNRTGNGPSNAKPFQPWQSPALSSKSAAHVQYSQPCWRSQRRASASAGDKRPIVCNV